MTCSMLAAAATPLACGALLRWAREREGGGCCTAARLETERGCRSLDAPLAPPTGFAIRPAAAAAALPPLPPPPPPPLPPLPGVVSRVNATSTQEQFICFRSHNKRSSRTTAPTSLAAASASSAELPASWARVRLPVATSRCKCTAAPPSAPHSAIPRSPSTVSPTASVCPPNTRGQRCAHDISRRTHRKLWWTATNSEFIDTRGELRMLNTEPASPRTSYGAPSAPLKSMSARVVAWSSEPIPPRPEPHSEPRPTPNPNPHQVGEQLQP